MAKASRCTRLASGRFITPTIWKGSLTTPVGFDRKLILDHLNLDVKRGEILGFVGASGAGKSVLTRTIIGLMHKINGNIEVFGVDMDAADEVERRAVERRWGVLFQHGALFSSLSVRQNIQFPMREFMNVSEKLLDEIAIVMAGSHNSERPRPFPLLSFVARYCAFAD